MKAEKRHQAVTGRDILEVKTWKRVSQFQEKQRDLPY